MSDLPPGWEWATFSNVARIASNLVDPANRPEMPHVGPNHIEPWTGRLLEYRSVAEDGVTSSKHRFFPGQILYSKIRPYLAKVALADFAGLCSADMYPIDSAIDSRYLKWWMLTPRFTEEVGKHQGRSLLPKINAKALNTIPVPVPPLAEQRRIVAALEDHLSRLDAGNTLLDDADARATSFRDAVIAAGCTGAIAVRNDVAPAPSDAGTNDGELPAIPVNWQWKRLAQIADVVGGVTKDAKKQTDPSLSEVPYLRVANVQRGHLDLSHVATIRVPELKVKQLALETGDVLLNEGGDRDKLARGWIWEDQIAICIHQNHVFRARVRDAMLHPKLLAWHANSFGKIWAEANGKQSVNLASISLSRIRLLPVPVPPREEQERIVAKIEDQLKAIERQLVAIRVARCRADVLRRSLLAETFAGRLVPQDPRDEPASILLEQIRAERAARLKAKRNRSTKADPAQEALP